MKLVDQSLVRPCRQGAGLEVTSANLRQQAADHRVNHDFLHATVGINAFGVVTHLIEAGRRQSVIQSALQYIAQASPLPHDLAQGQCCAILQALAYSELANSFQTSQVNIDLAGERIRGGTSPVIEVGLGETGSNTGNGVPL